MNGKIMKGIAGFYYVMTKDGLFECKAKGGFRKDKIKPLVGDNVSIEITDQAKFLGNITEILPRNNSLIRPSCANVDGALIIFAIVRPEPNYNLLDRFLINVLRQNLPCTICFNKMDIATKEEMDELREAYEGCGCKVLFLSGSEGVGLEEVLEELQGKTTVIAGPSGVGKSTLVNRISPEANMETGEISHKIDRGKHTTRHAELFTLRDVQDSYIMDTPGFTSLEVFDLEKEELWEYYPEFQAYEQYCKFKGCSHISEPVCGVKDALAEGKISRIRYNNYVKIYDDLKGRKKY